MRFAGRTMNGYVTAAPPGQADARSLVASWLNLALVCVQELPAKAKPAARKPRRRAAPTGASDTLVSVPRPFRATRVPRSATDTGNVRAPVPSCDLATRLRRHMRKNMLTSFAEPWFARAMTQRNSQPQLLDDTSSDVALVRDGRLAAVLVLVLVLITVTTSAGVGFA
jgi:hypothetical protein